jgi:hypothetical protein
MKNKRNRCVNPSKIVRLTQDCVNKDVMCKFKTDTIRENND